ncbi:recombinase family protein [Streptomyces sp. NPDC102264]|uniref:recombinase family protein n=1 Tax=Streptomyces sp. NPDC102264 TaxID=3366149 RepID=UPI00381B0F84
MEQPRGQDPSTLIDLFCRKSRAKASKGKREISISAQEARGRIIADHLGLTVRHVWREVGSASRFSRRKSRSDQDKALAALEGGEIGALWVFRLDRWDRRGAGAILKIVEPEDGRPRRLLFDNGDPDKPGIGLDSSNPRDRKELIRRAEEAREETEVLSERVLNTKNHQRANGEWVSAKAPYGLRVVIVEVEDEDGDIIEERKLELDDASADDPKDPTRTKSDVAFAVTYSMPVSNLSPRSIGMELNTGKVPSPSGGEWAHATVRDMIINPVYAGWQTVGAPRSKNRRMLFRDEAGNRVSVMSGPPLLTDEQRAEALGAALGNPGVGTGGTWTTTSYHRLTGILKCGGCGGAAVCNGRIYKCWKAGAGKPCPAPVFVSKRVLEEWVYFRWHAKLTSSEATDDLVYAAAERWAARVAPDATADSRAALNALDDAEAGLARVWADRRIGRYSGPSEAFFAPDLKDASDAVVKAKLAVEASTARRGVDVTFLMDAEMCTEAWDRASDEMKRDLIRLAVDTVTVTKAPYRGARFDGWERTSFKWADGTED